MTVLMCNRNVTWQWIIDEQACMFQFRQVNFGFYDRVAVIFFSLVWLSDISCLYEQIIKALTNSLPICAFRTSSAALPWWTNVPKFAAINNDEQKHPHHCWCQKLQHNSAFVYVCIKSHMHMTHFFPSLRHKSINMTKLCRSVWDCVVDRIYVHQLPQSISSVLPQHVNCNASFYCVDVYTRDVHKCLLLFSLWSLRGTHCMVVDVCCYLLVSQTLRSVDWPVTAQGAFHSLLFTF